MKKIILVLSVSVFCIAAYAGSPAAGKDKDACCADKAKAGATCQAGKSACCDKDSKKVKVVQSPKAAGQSDRAS